MSVLAVLWSEGGVCRRGQPMNVTAQGKSSSLGALNMHDDANEMDEE